MAEPAEDEEEEGKLHLDDLPNEILFQVLSIIDYKDRRTALLVCKRWYHLIDELIGRTLFVGRQCQLIPQGEDRYTHNYLDISAISKIGVTECYVGELQEEDAGMTLWSYLLQKIKKVLISGEEAPRFKYPFLLKTIHFDGPLPAAIFQSMTENTVNVTKLEMHFSSFCSLNPDALASSGLKWRRLQDLSIWGHRLTDGIFTTFYNSSNIIKNVIAFLSSTFRDLTDLSMEYPFDIRDDRELSRSLLFFMERHKKLERLKVCINVSFADEQSTDFFESATDREWMRDARMLSRQVRLKEMELMVSSMRRGRLTRFWSAFIEQQRALETAIILSFRIPTSLLTNVCESNRSSLKMLFISRLMMTHHGQPVQINCSILSPCTNLIRLTIEGMFHSFSEPGMVQTRLLPKSLVHLELGGFFINHQDVRDIFFELPSLAHLTLTDIGTQGQFGVPIWILEEVIADRRILTVLLYRSVNGTFPPNGIPNGDPDGGAIIRQRPYDILEFKLNTQGFYENVRRYSLFDEFSNN